MRTIFVYEGGGVEWRKRKSKGERGVDLIREPHALVVGKGTPFLCCLIFSKLIVNDTLPHFALLLQTSLYIILLTRRRLRF
jgi:hypothetical protein